MKRKKTLEFTPIGWQGLQFELPKDWNFNAESGNLRQGFIKLSSAYSTFELKWGKITDAKKFSIESVVEKLVKKLKKSEKNLKLLRKSSSKVFDHNSIYFDFKSDYKGRGIVWLCGKSEKLFIAILTAKPSDFKHAKLVLKCLLESIKCHVKGSWTGWSLFGFSLRAPSKFELKDRKFFAGHGTLTLSTEETHLLHKEETQVLFQYWSAANVEFEETYTDIEKWFEEFYEKELKKRYKWKTEKKEFQNIRINRHSAKMLRSTAKGGLTSLNISENNTYMWYCPQRNRIYALTLSKGMHKKRFIPSKKRAALPIKMFNKILSSVSCH